MNRRMSIASPINLILFSLFVVLLYYHFRPKPPVVLPRGPPPVVFKTYTPKTLLEFNGEGDRPVYLAVRGRVFDVTPGKNFYGPVCNSLLTIGNNLKLMLMALVGV